MGPASGAGGAEAGVVGEHGGADGDVGATVEEVVRLAAEASGPVERDGHVTDGGPAAYGLDGVDEPESVGGSSGGVVGVERREVGDEVLVADAQLVRERLDERIVKVNAAGEDEG